MLYFPNSLQSDVVYDGILVLVRHDG